MTTTIFTCRCVNISGIPHLNGQLGQFNPESDNKPWTCGIVRGNILDSTGQNPHWFLFHIIWVWKKGYPIPFAAWKFFVPIGVAISRAYSIPYTQLSDTQNFAHLVSIPCPMIFIPVKWWWLVLFIPHEMGFGYFLLPIFCILSCWKIPLF